MEHEAFDSKEWEVAKAYAYQANQVRDEWLVVKAVNERLTMMGIPDSLPNRRYTAESQLKSQYNRLNDLVGLIVGPAPDEYRDYMGLNSESNHDSRVNAITYFIDGVPSYIYIDRQ